MRSPAFGASLVASVLLAIGCGGGGGSSADGGIDALPALPAPTLTGSAGDSTASLSWNAVAGAGGYEVTRTTVPSTSPKPVCPGLATTATSCTDTTLSSGQNYSYEVTALTGTGGSTSPRSNAVMLASDPLIDPTRLATVTADTQWIAVGEGARSLAGLTAALSTKFHDVTNTSAIAVRDLMNGALALLLFEHHPDVFPNAIPPTLTTPAAVEAEVEAWVDFALAGQFTTDDAGGFPGSIPNPNGTGTIDYDTNGTEFAGAAMTALYYALPGDVTDTSTTKHKLAVAMAATAAALDAHFHLVAFDATVHVHPLDTFYTNAALMAAIEQLEIGEALAQMPIIMTGLTDFNAVYADLNANGIHEFASTTYYATDLDALLYGYSYVTDATVHAKIAQMLDVIWSDTAAGYFPGNGVIAGAHSRDYSFLYGTGQVGTALYAEGVLNEATNRPGPELEDVSVIANLVSSAPFHPGYDSLAYAGRALSATYPATSPFATKEMIATWDNRFPNADRTLYVTPGFAIGSTGIAYSNWTGTVAAPGGDIDKIFDFQFAPGVTTTGGGDTLLTNLVSVSYQTDAYGSAAASPTNNAYLVDDSIALEDPYGIVHCNGGKPCHDETISAAQVQDQAGVLTMLDYPSGTTATFDQLVTSIVVPVPTTSGTAASPDVFTLDPSGTFTPLATVPVGATASLYPCGVAPVGMGAAPATFGTNWVFGERVLTSCIAIRVLEADQLDAGCAASATTTSATPASIGITSDGTGAALHAGRLAICHYDSVTAATHVAIGAAVCPLRTAIYTEAAACADDAALQMLMTNVAALGANVTAPNATDWAVTVPAHGAIRELELAQTIATGAITSREIGGIAVHAPTFQLVDPANPTHVLFDFWPFLFPPG